MISKKSKHALLSRGIDSLTVDVLLRSGLSISKLKSLTIDELISKGIREEIAEKILKEQRPPIPTATVVSLLHKSKSMCCICRTQDKSIIIHHIEPWEISKNHDFDNLIVLCLDHHDEAHSKKELSQNLTPSILKRLKNEWIEQVAQSDTNAILGLIQVEHARWEYINHQRLFEIAIKLGINFQTLPGFPYLKEIRMIDGNGILKDMASWKIKSDLFSYMYDFEGRLHLYQYMKNVLEKTLERLTIIDISNKWNKTDLSCLNAGNLISCQGGYYFKRLSTNPGRNQTIRGYKKADKILLNFVIDAWEATSCSAWASLLSRHQNVTSICFIKSISFNKGILEIDASCLAIGTSFKLQIHGGS